MPSRINASMKKEYNVMASFIPVIGTLLIAVAVNALARALNNPRSIAVFSFGFLGFSMLGLWTWYYAKNLRPRFNWEPKGFKLIAVLHFLIAAAFLSGYIFVRNI